MRIVEFRSLISGIADETWRSLAFRKLDHDSDMLPIILRRGTPDGAIRETACLISQKSRIPASERFPCFDEIEIHMKSVNAYSDIRDNIDYGKLLVSAISIFVYGNRR